MQTSRYYLKHTAEPLSTPLKRMTRARFSTRST